MSHDKNGCIWLASLFHSRARFQSFANKQDTGQPQTKWLVIQISELNENLNTKCNISHHTQIQNNPSNQNSILFNYLIIITINKFKCFGAYRITIHFNDDVLTVNLQREKFEKEYAYVQNVFLN